MNTISIQDIINGEFNYSSLPVISYGQYGIDYVDAVGVGKDKNIYLARTYEELTSVRQNQVYIQKCICGISDLLKMMRDIKYLLCSDIGGDISVYVKDFMGCVVPVKQVIEDEDAARLVFVTEGRYING